MRNYCCSLHWAAAAIGEVEEEKFPSSKICNNLYFFKGQNGLIWSSAKAKLLVNYKWHEIWNWTIVALYIELKYV